MATLRYTDAAWSNTQDSSIKQSFNLWTWYTAFADGQAANRTLWFFISLMVQGVVLLPIPAVLIYYYNAPITVLFITMVCFFTSFIANMGGAGIRTTLLCFAVSIMLHVGMIAAVLF
ncbi:hypothetical protein ACFGVR_12675 [Mucilaginibacter sp. AW1-3]